MLPCTPAIESLCAALIEEGVLVDAAKKMEAFLRKNLKNGNHTGITYPTAFAEKSAEDLRSVSHDKYLRVCRFTLGVSGQAARRLVVQLCEVT